MNKIRDTQTIKKGTCVNIRGYNLFHILRSDKQKGDIKQYRNSRNFYQLVVSGNGKQGYPIKFENVPVDDDIAYVRHMGIIVVFEEGEKEVHCNHTNKNSNHAMEAQKNKEDLQQAKIN